MGLIDDIAARPGIELREDPTVPLVRLEDAKAFVDACESEGVSILGIDSLEIIETETISRIEEIADLSENNGPYSSFDAAREFIQWLGSRDRMLEFVLDEAD